MKFIQIRGCMGSGKTSIVRQFIEPRDFEVQFIEVFGKRYPYSIDKKRNIVISGRYDRAICGGIDGIIRDKNLMKEYLIKLIKTLSPNLFVFEAVMYGITFKFSDDLNKILSKLGYEYIAIVPVAPFDVLIERISIRNGGKPFKVEAVEKQYTRCLQSSKKLQEANVKIKWINTANYQKDKMFTILEEMI